VSPLGAVARLLAVAAVAGCAAAEARDPRLDRSNIFQAGLSVSRGDYDLYLDQRRAQAEEAVARQRAAEADNLAITQALSQGEARRRVLQREVASLDATVADLDRKAAAAQADSTAAQARKAELDTRRAALNAEADSILAGDASGSDAELERRLTELQAENRILAEEYELLVDG
jgi:chromosome segregation ATPase